MRVEQFATGDSLMHRFDPRCKIVLGALFSLVVATSSSLLVAALGLGAASLFVAGARLSWVLVFRRLVVVNLFNLFLWLIMPLSHGGPALFSLAGISFSAAGISLAGLVTIKANAIFLALVALVATSPLVAVGQALGRLGVPDKFVHLLLFTFRYIHVIELEWQRLFQAAQVRGFRPKANMHTYRTYAYMVGMLLVKSFSRSKRVYEAMLCRGFQGRLYSLHEFSLAGRDIFLSLVLLGGISGLMWMEWLQKTTL